MSLSRYLGQSLGELALVFVSAWACACVSVNGFHIDGLLVSMGYAGRAALVGALVLLCVLVLYVLSYRRTALLARVVAYIALLAVLVAVALALSGGENVYEDAEGNWLYLVLVPTLLATACFLLTRTILGSTLWFVVAAFACCLVQAFYEVGEVGMSLVASACALMLVVHRNFQLGLEHADLARKPSPARNFAASAAPVAAVAAVALAVWFGIIAPLSPGVLDVKLFTDYRQPPIEEWKGVIKANPTYNTDLTTENLVEGFLYTTDDLVEDVASDISIDVTSLLEQQEEQETDGGEALDAGEDTGGGVDEDFDEEETEEERYDAQSYSWQFPWIIVRIVLVVLLVGAVVGYFVGRRAWRRRNLERILALPPREQAVQLYLFLLERLRRIGFSVPAGLTLAEYASSSARQMDMLTEETRVAFTDITQTYERCAYGKLEPSEEDVAPLVEYYLWFWKAARTQLGNFRYFFKSFRL